MRSRFLAILISAVLACLLASGVAVQAAPLTKIKLSETVRSVFYVPMYAAFTQGFFEKEGLDVELSTAWGGDKCAAALLSGSVDINMMGPEAAVYIYNQGAPNPLVLFAELTAKDGSFLVGRKPEPNFKWSDLRDKKVIGARPGGMPELCLEYSIRKSGLVLDKDVELVKNIAYTATAGAFASGLGDYVALFEPAPSQMEKDGQGHVVASIGEGAGPTAYTGFHCREDWIKTHPDVLQRFTNAIYRAMLWSQRRTPQELVAAIKPFFDTTDNDVLLRCVTRYQKIGAWQKTPVITDDSFIRLQDIVAIGGELTKRVPFDEMCYNRFAERAVATIKNP